MSTHTPNSNARADAKVLPKGFTREPTSEKAVDGMPRTRRIKDQENLASMLKYIHQQLIHIKNQYGDGRIIAR